MIDITDKCDWAIRKLHIDIVEKYGNKPIETKEEQKELIDAVKKMLDDENSNFDYRMELIAMTLDSLWFHNNIFWKGII